MLVKPPQMKLNPPISPAVRQISSRSDFIHRMWISPANVGFNWKKPSAFANGFFLGRGRRIPYSASLRSKFVLRSMTAFCGAKTPNVAPVRRFAAGGFSPPNYNETKEHQAVGLVFFCLAGAGGFEPATHGFGDRYSTSWAIPLCAVFSATFLIITQFF